MPNLYIEARPKGRPEGSAIDDSWWKVTRITCSPPSRRRRGCERTTIRLVLHSCGISLTRKSRIGTPPSLNGTRFLSGRSFGAT
jgi:hypothetical protein